MKTKKGGCACMPECGCTPGVVFFLVDKAMAGVVSQLPVATMEAIGAEWFGSQRDVALPFVDLRLEGAFVFVLDWGWGGAGRAGRAGAIQRRGWRRRP